MTKCRIPFFSKFSPLSKAWSRFFKNLTVRGAIADASSYGFVFGRIYSFKAVKGLIRILHLYLTKALLQIIHAFACNTKTLQKKNHDGTWYPS